MFARRLLMVWVCLGMAKMCLAEESFAEAVKALVQPRIDRDEALGIVVGLVREGRREVFGYGRQSLDGDRRVNGQTIFEIGSITKVFTSIALADMAEAGLVKLDDPVQSLLPEGRRVPEHDQHVMTLRMLSNHTSGLPRVIPKVFARSLAGKDPYAEVSAKDIYDFLETYQLKRDPGSKYDYSNLGAGLLGTVLARRAGVSFEELILARICRPLEMRDTSVTVGPAHESRLAQPYSSRGKPAKPWVFDAFAGAGALHSTADDMLRFVSANLKLTSAPGSLKTSLDTVMMSRLATGSPGLSIALGWHVFEAQERTGRPEIIWHNGGTGGFRGFIGLVREKRLGVVVLSSSDSPVDEVGLKVIERLVHELK